MPRPPLLWLRDFRLGTLHLVANQNAPISPVSVVAVVVGITGAGHSIDISSIDSCVAVSPSIMGVAVALSASIAESCRARSDSLAADSNAAIAGLDAGSVARARHTARSAEVSATRRGAGGRMKNCTAEAGSSRKTARAECGRRATSSKGRGARGQGQLCERARWPKGCYRHREAYGYERLPQGRVILSIWRVEKIVNAQSA